MTSVIQEDGFYGSHFYGNSGQFSNSECIYEKVDNSYSAGASLVLFGYYEKYIFIIDDGTMTDDDYKAYCQLYRSSKVKNKRNNGRYQIGCHGLGGREADSKLCKNNKTYVFSKIGRKTNHLLFDYKQMKEDYENDEKYPITPNIKTLRQQRIKLCRLLLKEYNIKTGTIFLYEYENEINCKNNYEKIFEETKNDIGLIYNDYLKDEEEPFEIKFMKPDKQFEPIIRYDPFFLDILKEKIPTLMYEDVNLYQEYFYSIYYNKNRELNQTLLEIKFPNEVSYYSIKNNNVNPIKNFKKSEFDIIIDNKKVDMIYGVPLQENIRNKIKNKEKTSFNDTFGGILIKRDSRVITANTYFPKGKRKNENTFCRGVLNLENDDYDKVLPPSFNKSKLLISKVIDKLLYYIFGHFRSQFEIKINTFSMKNFLINNNENSTTSDSNDEYMPNYITMSENDDEIMDDTDDLSEMTDLTDITSITNIIYDTSEDNRQIKKRKGFKKSIEKDAYLKQSKRCNLFKITIDPTNYDVDHKDDDNTNNNPENCQLLSIYAHALKTRQRLTYNHVITDDKFRKQIIIQEINRWCNVDIIPIKIQNKIRELLRKI
jgi:hypothetical protein